tara:strand:+ start:20383 stop:21087 length:705 start_codon:yes stop_codon:yes gene_type:complete
MIHSAFRRFSRAGFELDAVLESLVDYMSGGTLLLPTMSWRYINHNNPHFDEIRTPSNTGALGEVFRHSFATRRSLHPTHSVAGIGRDLDYFLGEHHLDTTPCGKRSPFKRLVEADGQILMMGIGMDCCTLIHQIEEEVASDVYLKGPSQAVQYTSTDSKNVTHDVTVRHHHLMKRNYWQFQDMLHSQGCLWAARCGAPVCNGFNARSLAAVTMDSLRADKFAALGGDGDRYRMM